MSTDAVDLSRSSIEHVLSGRYEPLDIDEALDYVDRHNIRPRLQSYSGCALFIYAVVKGGSKARAGELCHGNKRPVGGVAARIASELGVDRDYVEGLEMGYEWPEEFTEMKSPARFVKGLKDGRKLRARLQELL